VEGQKISKSLGNVVDPVELVEGYGTEALRYYLLREIPAAEDGDFTRERFLRAYNGDLANNLGNLLNRVVSMVGRYCGGAAPSPGPAEGPDVALIAAARELRGRVDAAMERFAPHEALAAVWELVDATNRYVEETAPWALAKRRKAGVEGAEARLGAVLYNQLEALRLTAHYCAPFLPATAEALATQLGIPLETGADWERIVAWGGYPAGTHMQPGSVLFPRIEEDEAVGI